ncbi:hypothetical protein RUND412_007203 [Rhizina undulata]
MFPEWYNNTIYASQVELEDSRMCVMALKTALPRMSNIRRLSPGYDTMNLSDEFDIWRGTLTNHYDTDVHGYWYAIMHAMVPQKIQTIESETRVVKHFLDLVIVSSRVGLKPDWLGTDTSLRRYWPSLWHGFFADSSGVLRSCAPLTESLTTLSLHVTTLDHISEDFKAFKKEYQEGKFHKFLSSAPNLRSLYLNFGDRFERPVLEIPDLFGRTRIWSQLHTLSLTTTCTLKWEELAQFLSFHSTTLKDLSLRLSYLKGSMACRGLLDVLHEQLCLKRFKISFSAKERFCDDEFLRMEDYVLHRGPPFPPTEMELEEKKARVF